MHNESRAMRLIGWLPGFLLALPIVAVWVMRAVLVGGTAE